MPSSTSVRASIASFIRTNFALGNVSGYASGIFPDNVIEGYAGLNHGWLPQNEAYPRVFLVMEDSAYSSMVSSRLSKTQTITVISMFQVAASVEAGASLQELERQVNAFVEDVERMVTTNPTIGGVTQLVLLNQEDDLGASDTQATVVMTLQASFTLRY